MLAFLFYFLCTKVKYRGGFSKSFFSKCVFYGYVSMWCDRRSICLQCWKSFGKYVWQKSSGEPGLKCWTKCKISHSRNSHKGRQTRCERRLQRHKFCGTVSKSCKLVKLGLEYSELRRFDSFWGFLSRRGIIICYTIVLLYQISKIELIPFEFMLLHNTNFFLYDNFRRCLLLFLWHTSQQGKEDAWVGPTLCLGNTRSTKIAWWA